MLPEAKTVLRRSKNLPIPVCSKHEDDAHDEQVNTTATVGTTVTKAVDIDGFYMSALLLVVVQVRELDASKLPEIVKEEPNGDQREDIYGARSYRDFL